VSKSLRGIQTIDDPRCPIAEDCAQIAVSRSGRNMYPSGHKTYLLRQMMSAEVEGCCGFGFEVDACADVDAGAGML